MNVNITVGGAATKHTSSTTGGSGGSGGSGY